MASPTGPSIIDDVLLPPPLLRSQTWPQTVEYEEQWLMEKQTEWLLQDEAVRHRELEQHTSETTLCGLRQKQQQRSVQEERLSEEEEGIEERGEESQKQQLPQREGIKKEERVRCTRGEQQQQNGQPQHQHQHHHHRHHNQAFPRRISQEAIVQPQQHVLYAHKCNFSYRRGKQQQHQYLVCGADTHTNTRKTPRPCITQLTPSKMHRPGSNPMSTPPSTTEGAAFPSSSHSGEVADHPPVTQREVAGKKAPSLPALSTQEPHHSDSTITTTTAAVTITTSRSSTSVPCVSTHTTTTGEHPYPICTVAMQHCKKDSLLREADATVKPSGETAAATARVGTPHLSNKEDTGERGSEKVHAHDTGRFFSKVMYHEGGIEPAIASASSALSIGIKVITTVDSGSTSSSGNSREAPWERSEIRAPFLPSPRNADASCRHSVQSSGDVCGNSCNERNSNNSSSSSSSEDTEVCDTFTGNNNNSTANNNNNTNNSASNNNTNNSAGDNNINSSGERSGERVGMAKNSDDAEEGCDSSQKMIQAKESDNRSSNWRSGSSSESSSESSSGSSSERSSGSSSGSGCGGDNSITERSSSGTSRYGGGVGGSRSNSTEANLEGSEVVQSIDEKTVTFTYKGFFFSRRKRRASKREGHVSEKKDADQVPRSAVVISDGRLSPVRSHNNSGSSSNGSEHKQEEASGVGAAYLPELPEVKEDDRCPAITTTSESFVHASQLQNIPPNNAAPPHSCLSNTKQQLPITATHEKEKEERKGEGRGGRGGDRAHSRGYQASTSSLLSAEGQARSIDAVTTPARTTTTTTITTTTSSSSGPSPPVGMIKKFSMEGSSVMTAGIRSDKRSGKADGADSLSFLPKERSVCFKDSSSAPRAAGTLLNEAAATFPRDEGIAPRPPSSAALGAASACNPTYAPATAKSVDEGSPPTAPVAPPSTASNAGRTPVAEAAAGAIAVPVVVGAPAVAAAATAAGPAPAVAAWDVRSTGSDVHQSAPLPCQRSSAAKIAPFAEKEEEEAVVAAAPAEARTGVLASRDGVAMTGPLHPGQKRLQPQRGELVINSPPSVSEEVPVSATHKISEMPTDSGSHTSQKTSFFVMASVAPTRGKETPATAAAPTAAGGATESGGATPVFQQEVSLFIPAERPPAVASLTGDSSSGGRVSSLAEAPHNNSSSGSSSSCSSSSGSSSSCSSSSGSSSSGSSSSGSSSSGSRSSGSRSSGSSSSGSRSSGSSSSGSIMNVERSPLEETVVIGRYKSSRPAAEKDWRNSSERVEDEQDVWGSRHGGPVLQQQSIAVCMHTGRGSNTSIRFFEGKQSAGSAEATAAAAELSTAGRLMGGISHTADSAAAATTAAAGATAAAARGSGGAGGGGGRRRRPVVSGGWLSAEEEKGHDNGGERILRVVNKDISAAVREEREEEEEQQQRPGRVAELLQRMTQSRTAAAHHSQTGATGGLVVGGGGGGVAGPALSATRSMRPTSTAEARIDGAADVEDKNTWTMPAVEAFVLQLRRGELRGSHQAARRTAEVLRQVVDQHPWKTTQELLDVVKQLGRKFLRADPMEFLVSNVVRRILCIIRTEHYRQLRKRQPCTEEEEEDEGGDENNTSEQRRQVLQGLARSSSTGAHGDMTRLPLVQIDGFRTSPIRSAYTHAYSFPSYPGHVDDPQQLLLPVPSTVKHSIFEGISELLAEVDTAWEEGEDVRTACFSNGDCILTYGYSLAVERLLKALHRKNQGEGATHSSRKKKKKGRVRCSFQVLVLGGDTEQGGKKMAERLVAAGIKTAYVAEAALLTIIHKVDKVLIGTRAILSSGGAVALSGARYVAEAAKIYSRPLMVVAPLYKLTHLPLYDQHSRNQLLSPSAVLPDLPELKNVCVRIPKYDYIPDSLLAVFITEIGPVDPSCLFFLAQQRYDIQDLDLSAVV